MKIHLHLNWLNDAKAQNKPFRSLPIHHLFQEYKERIQYFAVFNVCGRFEQRSAGGGGAIELWACDSRGKAFSSEKLAEEVKRLQQKAIKDWHVIIGGPDGVGPKKAEAQLVWSFGPLTLPHELAAVVATEQIYRAFTIINNHPYHAGH